MVGSVPSAIGPSSWSLSASATSLMAAACSSTLPRHGHDLLAERRRQDLLLAALEQHAELFLELLDRDAQRRLAHVATLGRAAEMLLLGQRDDVAEFGEGHGPASSLRAAPPSNLARGQPWECVSHGQSSCLTTIQWSPSFNESQGAPAGAPEDLRHPPSIPPDPGNRLFVLGQPDSSNGAYQGSDLGGFVKPRV